MIPLVAALALAPLLAQGPADGLKKGITIVRPGESHPAILLQVSQEPMDPPRESPKKFGYPAQPWLFDWLTTGYIYVPEVNKFALRFRVYAQEKKETNDPAPRVAQMLTTMWGESNKRIKLDHSLQYNGQIVDVFLCWGGKAGGEQRFDVTTENNVRKSVNTIYFYAVNSFKEPMEMAREVAHEYGHAALPAIGGYTAPEGWANGYLGEKLFLTWIRQGMADGRLTSEDAMGATPEQIDTWLAANVDPLVVTAATNFPTAAALQNPSARGMDRYLGLALFAANVLPDSIFGRSLLLTGSTDAKDYPAALVLATEEPNEYEIKIPKLLADKPIWLPTGKGKITGGKILKFASGWALVEAPEGKLTVVNRKG